MRSKEFDQRFALILFNFAQEDPCFRKIGLGIERIWRVGHFPGSIVRDSWHGYRPRSSTSFRASSDRWMKYWVRKYRRGNIQPKPHGGHPPSVTERPEPGLDDPTFGRGAEEIRGPEAKRVSGLGSCCRSQAPGRIGAQAVASFPDACGRPPGLQSEPRLLVEIDRGFRRGQSPASRREIPGRQVRWGVLRTMSETSIRIPADPAEFCPRGLSLFRGPG